MKNSGKMYHYDGKLDKAVKLCITQFEQSVGYKPVKILVKESEYHGEEFGIPVETTRCIQSMHFMLALKFSIKRVPRLFGGKKCPVIR